MQPEKFASEHKRRMDFVIPAQAGMTLKKQTPFDSETLFVSDRI